jgi:DNA mismatch repair protein MutS2
MRARVRFMHLIKGVIPEVGSDGCVEVREARHPVLALRDVSVVGNDITLNNDTQALILSGPNAGTPGACDSDCS